MTLALSVIVFFIFGVIIYYLDSKIGVPFKRSWYNMTHKNKLDPSIQRGFIVNATLVSRSIVAILIAGTTFVLSMLYGNLHTLLYALLAVAQLFALILGFYFAAKILKIVPPVVNKATDYLDKMEKGEVNVKKDIVESSKKAVESLKKEKSKEEKPMLENPKKEIPKEQKKEDKDGEDWRTGIDDFMKK